MSCTGCEYDGIFALVPAGESDITAFDHGSVWTSTVSNVPPRAEPDPESAVTLSMIPGYELRVPESGLKRNSAFNVSQNPGGTHTGAAGVHERAKKLAEKAAATPDEQTYLPDPFGWRFAPDNPDQLGDRDPTMVYMIPLYFGHTPQDGTCSSASVPGCEGGTPCAASILYTFEIHSVILSDKRPKGFPLPASPSSFTPTDPNGVTSNVTTSIQSGFGRYESSHDPRGVANPEGQTSYVTTKIVELNVKITASACGGWGIWKTNFSDWDVAIPGYSHTSADANDVPDESIVFGVACMECEPVDAVLKIPDDGSGSQGGGKNFNQSSI